MKDLRAYIDPNSNLLVIRTHTKKEEEMIKQEWSEHAFGGLKIIEKN